MRKLLSVIALWCLFVSTALAHVSLIKGNHSNEKQDNFRTEKVAGNVYALFGRGGNIGVSYGTDGLLTIDTQFADIADKIKAELKKLGSDKPKFVFNTHWHGDHTGGNEIFGQDAIIIAHKNVRDRLLNTTMFRGQARTPTAKVGLPMITYNEGLSVYFNGEEIRAVHFEHGHTDGDTVIFFTGSNVVHLGDDFFVGRFPFVDLESGGSVEGLVRNIGELIQMIPSDAKLIPGHGAVSTIDDLKNYHQMLIDTTLIVRKQMKEGKSLDEIKKTGFSDQYKEAGSGFINTDAWIETIYKSYSMDMMKK
ncbi:MAG: MBL fold metallo-hydrolase [Pyrinomonadaceae bacterium]